MFVYIWITNMFDFSTERLLWTHTVHMMRCSTADLIRACFLGIQFLCTGGTAFSVGKNFQWVTRFKRQLQNTSSFAFFSSVNPLLNLSMEILLVKDFVTHEFHNKISVHLLLGFLAHLLYNIQLIQSTAANMFVQLCLDAARWFSLNWRVFWGFIFLPWADRSGRDLSYWIKMMVLSP